VYDDNGLLNGLQSIGPMYKTEIESRPETHGPKILWSEILNLSK